MESGLIMMVWISLGFVGSLLLLGKSAEKGRAVVFFVFSLIHAVVFGPIFLFLVLMVRAQKLCEHCKSEIRRDARVCSECTRDVVM